MLPFASADEGKSKDLQKKMIEELTELGTYTLIAAPDVNEDVQAAEVRADLVDHPLPVGGLTHIALAVNDVAAGTPQFGHRVGDRSGVAHAIDCEVAAFGGEMLRDREPDAACPAGDQRDFSVIRHFDIPPFDHLLPAGPKKV